MPELLLALDAGTTGVRAMVTDVGGIVLGVCKQRIESHFPAPGRVEQDADAVWEACRAVIDGALAGAGRTPADIAAIGLTTQRASVVVWDRRTGRAAAPMIVWSDLRGMARYRELRAAGFLSWPQVPAAKLEAALAAAEGSDLAWGTLDSWLLWKLSGGSVHATDLSAAWISGYVDPGDLTRWNADLLAFQGLSERMFPKIVDSWGEIGAADALGGIPVTALLADQQASMVAHGVLAEGAWKMTYGTSGVLMMSTGVRPVSPHRTMPVAAMTRVGGGTRFCIEGMVVSTGSFVEWLCGLGLFASGADLETAAASVEDAKGVTIRPSLQGLGAPHGRFDVQALIAGLSLGAGRAHIARAALTGIACRVREIVDVLAASEFGVPETLPVDGGLSASGTLLQLQADLIGRPVRRHAVAEGSAFGAAIAAGIGSGLFTGSGLTARIRYDRDYQPAISADAANALFTDWQTAALGSL